MDLVDTEKRTHASMKDPRTNELLQSLIKCIVACEHCATACLQELDARMMAACVLLDRDCADACTYAARLIGRDSPRAAEALRSCVELCRACAAECDRHIYTHCRICAEKCKECHERCTSYLREMHPQQALA